MCACVASGVYVCVYAIEKLFFSIFSISLSFFARKFFSVGFSFHLTVYACVFLFQLFRTVISQTGKL